MSDDFLDDDFDFLDDEDFDTDEDFLEEDDVDLAESEEAPAEPPKEKAKKTVKAKAPVKKKSVKKKKAKKNGASTDSNMLKLDDKAEAFQESWKDKTGKELTLNRAKNIISTVEAVYRDFIREGKEFNIAGSKVRQVELKPRAYNSPVTGGKTVVVDGYTKATITYRPSDVKRYRGDIKDGKFVSDVKSEQEEADKILKSING